MIVCTNSREAACNKCGRDLNWSITSTADRLWQLYEAMTSDRFSKHVLSEGDWSELSARDFLADLDRSIRLLHREAEPFPLVRIMKGGSYVPKADFCIDVNDAAGRTHEELSPSKITGLFQNGATVNVNQCERISPKLGQIVDDLRTHSGKAVQINLYASKGTTPGFNPHYDNHDVIVFQAFGRKKWIVEPQVRKDFEVPAVNENWGQEVIIDKGTVLLIPRGLWHSVCSIGELSIHYTIGFHHGHRQVAKSCAPSLLRSFFG